MPPPIFPPTKDADLLTWSANFNTEITASAITFGLDAAQATAFDVLHTAYATTYATATSPMTNSKANINAKNQAKQQLLYAPGGAWELVNIVQAFPGTTNTMRGDLGLRIPDSEQTPIAAPKMAPNLSIVSTAGRLVKIRLQDQEKTDKRGKPIGVQGATILYYVGDVAPADPSLWIFSTNSSKTVFDVDIPASVTAGAKVWITAFWFNARMQSSPAATPEFTRVSDGLALAA